MYKRDLHLIANTKETNIQTKETYTYTKETKNKHKKDLSVHERDVLLIVMSHHTSTHTHTIRRTHKKSLGEVTLPPERQTHTHTCPDTVIEVTLPLEDKHAYTLV